MKNLSKAQLDALRILDGRAGNAYSLRLNLGTLNSLRLRKLAKSSFGTGGMFDQRAGIDWAIPPAGRRALAAQKSRREPRWQGDGVAETPMKRALLELTPTAWEAAVLPLNYTRADRIAS